MKTANRAGLLPLVLSVQFLFSGAAKAADYAIGADLSILKQAERGSFLIFPGTDARLFYLLSSKLPKNLVL